MSTERCDHHGVTLEGLAMRLDGTRRLFLVSCWVLLSTTVLSSPLYAHPQVFWNDPPDSRNLQTSLVRFINRADTSLDFAIYQFRQPAIVDALVQAKERGVQVRMVTEKHYYEDDDYKPLYRRLEEAGIPIQPDDRSSDAHNKFMVVDGEAVWTGSTNVTDNGFTKNANNAVIVESEALARAYTQEFEEMFDGNFSTDKEDNTPHHFNVGPLGRTVELYFSPTDRVRSEILEELKDADHNVYVSLNLFTVDSIAKRLSHLDDTGVDVKVLLDEGWANRSYAVTDPLVAHGVPVHVYTASKLLHHKFVIIDYRTDSNPTVLTGSYNYSSSAEESNDENVLILHDPSLARAYYQIFERLWYERSKRYAPASD